MAINILPRRQTLGSSLGSALGTGLGSGLEMLAQQRLQGLLQQQQQKQTSNALQSLRFSPQEADQLALLPQQILQEVVKQKIKEPSQQAFAAGLADILGMSPQQQPQQEQVGQQIGQEQPQQEGVGQEESEQTPFTGLTEKQALELSKLKQKKEEIGLKEDKNLRERYKESREASAPYIEAAEASERDVRDYSLLSKLAKSGKIRAGIPRRALAMFGLDSWNENVPTQIAAKLIGRLKQNVSGAFGKGTRITNFLEQTFQESIPTLWNTPGGIETLSNINSKLAEVNIERNKAREKILKESNYRVPPDLEDEIKMRTSDKVNQIEQEVEDMALEALGENTQILAQLPLPNKVRVGQEAKRSDGVMLVSNGKEWVEKDVEKDKERVQ